jgi:enamine deaminase RidA (YjgF/YER057c/UK114 family)
MSEAARPLARYAAWRRAGDYVFRSGIIAVDPAPKMIVHGFEDIPPDTAAAIGATGEVSTDFKQGPILAQSCYVLDRVRQTAEAAGGRMEVWSSWCSVSPTWTIFRSTRRCAAGSFPASRRCPRWSASPG